MSSPRIPGRTTHPDEGPWHVWRDGTTVRHGEEPIARFHDGKVGDLARARALRAKACVNACLGLSIPELAKPGALRELIAQAHLALEVLSPLDPLAAQKLADALDAFEPESSSLSHPKPLAWTAAGVSVPFAVKIEA